MEALVRALHVVVPVLWTAAAAAYLVTFVRDDFGAACWGFRLLVLAIVAHLGEFAATAAIGIPPMVQPGAIVSGMGLATALIYLGLERRIGRATIGIFAIGTVALLAVAGNAAGDPFATPPAGLPTGKTSLHVAAAIVGYSGLLLAATFGALLLAQQGALRRRSFGLFWERLPSVELLEAFTTGSLLAATVFLTVTIGLGHLTRHDSDRMGPYWQEPKIVATNLLWLLTLVTYAARKAKRLRPRTVALASLGLFAVAMANLTIVNRISKVHEGL